MKHPVKADVLNLSYVERILNGEVTEDVIHEFKVKEYLLNTKDEKRDFLRDILGMLNSVGGVIFTGVADDGEIEGVKIEDVDLYKRQLLQIINTYIEPQIIGVDFKIINTGGKSIFAILVPEGDQKPYCLKINGEGREFVIRQNASNHHMSISEIRRLFLKNPPQEDPNESWDNWKKAKVSAVLNNKWFQPLMETRCILLLIHPLESGPTANLIDTQKIENVTDRKMYIWPPHSNGCTLVPFDKGIFTVGRAKGDFGTGEPCYSYVLVENNSSFEVYDGMTAVTLNDKKIIDPSIDKSIFTYVERAMDFLKDAGFESFKYQVSLNLLNLKGYKITRDTFMYAFPGSASTAIGIPSDSYELTTVLAVGSDVKKGLKPIFDRLWQSSGFSRCFRYNEAGEYIGKSDY